MEVINQLLIEAGGGIWEDRPFMETARERACVAIGLGGLGVKALKSLKQKVYQTFKPEDGKQEKGYRTVEAEDGKREKEYRTFEPEGRKLSGAYYNRLRFIGIDADEGEACRGRGALGGDEFLYIRDIAFANLLYTPMGRRALLADPRYGWIAVDEFERFPPMEEGTGGVRQLGRALFISQAGEVRARIMKALAEILAAGSADVTVFIFTGLAGGMGGGAFLDLCYIVRQTLRDLGASGKLRGVFFLPDVPTGLTKSPKAVSYMQSNGCAALMELNCLMPAGICDDRFNSFDREAFNRLMEPGVSSLDYRIEPLDRITSDRLVKPGGGRPAFRQDYGSFAIDLAEPPVDTCFLVSAIKEGRWEREGITRCIEGAADYALMQLMGTKVGSASHKSDPRIDYRRFFDRNRLAGRGGAFFALGAAVAALPRNEMTAYLAAGFMDRFQGCLPPLKAKESTLRSLLEVLVRSIGLGFEEVMTAVTLDTDRFPMPEADRSTLRSYGPMQKGALPECWERIGLMYLETNRARRAARCKELGEGCGGDIGVYVREQPAHALHDKRVWSFSGKKPFGRRIFIRLVQISANPNGGPYLAASLLGREGTGLGGYVDSLMDKMASERASLQGHLATDADDGLWEEIVEASADFVNLRLSFLNARRKYERYKAAVQQYFDIRDRIGALEDALGVMSSVKKELKTLSDAYFVPCIRMLDQLTVTAQANRAFLDRTKGAASKTRPVQIISLDEVREELDKAIGALTPDVLITAFMERTHQTCEAWLAGDPDRIAAAFSDFIVDIFEDQVNMDLTACLKKKFPAARNKAEEISAFEREVIRPLYDKAEVLFWFDALRRRMDTYRYGAAAAQSGGGDIGQETFEELSLVLVPEAVAAELDYFVKEGVYSSEGRRCLVMATDLTDRIYLARMVKGIPLSAYGGMERLRAEYERSRDVLVRAGLGLHLLPTFEDE